MNMHFYWLQNQENQKHFQVYWEPSSKNLGENHTKYHQVAHHHAVCDIYLHRKSNKIQEWEIHRGCVDPEGPHTARLGIIIKMSGEVAEFFGRLLARVCCKSEEGAAEVGYDFEYIGPGGVI